MNKQQTPIDQLVRTLTDALTKPNGNGAQASRQRRKRSQSKRKKPSNPLTNQLPRDRSLNLTGTQFTATTPLQLFNVKSGSTPGGIRVKGRELITSVIAPAALTGQFALASPLNGSNPASRGNPIAFPRLSAYNPIYEYFVIHKITYIFQSNQPTTQPGEVIMCIDYDPTDAAPASTSEMMRNVSSTMSNVYSDNSLEALKSLSRLPKYECWSSLDGPEVLQADQYKLFVAFEGVTAANGATLGYVIAEYDVEFFTPQ